MEWTWRKPLAAGDVCSFWTSLSFDVSVYEIFSSLCSGATLNIVPEEVRAESGAFVGWLASNGITSGYVPAFALPELNSRTEKKEGPSALRRLLVGVEPIEEELLTAIQSNIPGLHVFNGYGPTEATVYATLYPVPATCCQSRRTPIGRPIANTQAYVLDRHLEPVPVGVAGELYIGGAGVARGYLGRPALTAERFIPDPFSREPGARLYRTGDLARHLPDGDLVFVGRADEQLKVRGFRVEPGEVEAALEAHPLVRAGHVMLRADGAQTRLVAYVSAEPDTVLTSGELRRHLKEQLPEYMIPSTFVTLDTLPLTPSGKVDRRRLPAPEDEASGGADSTAPRTPTEELLSGIWCEVLGRERVGARENFFDAGGHSLLATQIVARARAAFGVELPLRALFEHPTVAELGAAVDVTARGVSGPPITPAERGGALPMSFAQQRLWFLEQLEPGSPLYNQASAIRFRGELDGAALEQCLNEIVRRHEVLRTVFTNHEGHPRQVIIPSLTVPLRRYDLCDLRGDERESELRRLMDAEGRLPFDLARGPLLRVTLIRLGETEHVLLFTTHHIVSDGWSMGVLIREAGILYDSFARGADPTLAELPVQYSDYALWQASQEENHRAQLDYWVERLADAPPLLSLPTDRPRPPVQTHRGASVPFALSQELTDDLRRLARRRSATLFMVLLSGLKALLMRYTGETDIVVGTPIANRNRAETEPLIGFFVNTLALRTDLSGDPTFSELLARVRDVALGAYAHQEVPFERVVEEVRPERSLDHAPLFQVMLALDNTGRGEVRLGSLAAEAEEVGAGAAKFDLTVSVREEGGTLSGSLVYSADLFDEATAARLAAHFERLLRAAADDPSRRLSALPLLSEGERRRQVEEWNRTGRDFGAEQTLDRLVSEQAGRTPGAVAVVSGEEQVSYGELDARAETLGRYLRVLGVGAESRVGVLMERSVAMVVAILGVLKAGGTYVPLDSEYPEARLRWMAEDAGVVAVVTEAGLRAAAAGLGVAEVVCLDREWEQIGGQAGAAVGEESYASEAGEVPATVGVAASRAVVDPGQAAYVIYTSGSTGQPKGVVVTHHNIVNHLRWRQHAYPLSPADAFLHKAPPGFDIAVWELFAPLSAGARSVLAEPGGQRDAGYLAGLMAAGGVTVAHFGPAMLGAVAGEEALGGCVGLRHVFCGGEPLTGGLARAFTRRARWARVHQQYGPTEATVDATAWEWTGRGDDEGGEGDGGDGASVIAGVRVGEGRAVEGGRGGESGVGVRDVGGVGGEGVRLPIGRPIANTQAYVLDRHLEPVPVGVAGELYIGGAGVARGYLNRPALTAEKFIPDPFSPEPGARLYRTGDVARWLSDGELVFVGRADEQVKLRGFRVEPGEVEAALEAHPSVDKAVVVMREDTPGDPRLVAYLVGVAGGEAAGASELRRHLAVTLPEYMIPSAFVVLDALPLTPNGKVDRRALPKPDASGEPARGYVAPRTPTEEMLCGMWGEVLGVERVGVEDNFFELGGHSLLATRLFWRLHETLQVNVPLRALFEHPTVSALSPLVEKLQQEASAPSAPTIKAVSRDQFRKTVPTRRAAETSSAREGD
nr:AMP-dependent synthetase and ligase [uncultured bacterium]